MTYHLYRDVWYEVDHEDPSTMEDLIEDMLNYGTNINGVMIEKPHRFLTAMTIATQLITAVSSSQYGLA